MITVSIMLITLFALVTLLKYFNLYEGLHQGLDNDMYEEEYEYYEDDLNSEINHEPAQFNLQFFSQAQPPRVLYKHKSTPVPTIDTSSTDVTSIETSAANLIKFDHLDNN
jgi:hypothetical protein